MTETQVGGIAADRLLSIIERIERLEQQKREIADDIKEIKLDAKNAGFDVKVINAIIKERAQDKEKLAEFEELKDVYRHALGDLNDTPLGEAAIERASTDERTFYRDGKIAKHDSGGFRIDVDPLELSRAERLRKPFVEMTPH